MAKLKRIRVIRLTALALSTLTAIPMSAGATQEPPGSALFLNCPFSSSRCTMSTHGNEVFSNVTFSGQQPTSPTGVMDNNLKVGATSGGADAWIGLPSVREVYVATWWATNTNLDWNRNLANKILFVKGNGLENNLLVWHGDSNGTKRLMWYPQSESNNCHVVGWHGGCGAPGKAASGWFVPNGPHDGSVAGGSGWHFVEIYKKASTTGLRDGIVRIWIDGQLSTNYTNINESPTGFNTVMYDSTWDAFGCDPYDPVKYPNMLPAWYRDCSKERHHYYDHLRISFPNGATQGSSPSTPINLVVH